MYMTKIKVVVVLIRVILAVTANAQTYVPPVFGHSFCHG